MLEHIIFLKIRLLNLNSYHRVMHIARYATRNVEKKNYATSDIDVADIQLIFINKQNNRINDE